jgi:hypothetical protein
MEEGFDLPVLYKGKEMHFPARLLSMGYIYKIEVDVHGQSIVFERDEERNWRALMDPSIHSSDSKTDIELLKMIGQTIEEITN